MANTIQTITVIDDAINTVVHLTGIFDGSGDETNVKKVDIAAILKNDFGIQPTDLKVEQVRWAVQGMSYVQLIWDRTATPKTAMLLCNSGYDDFRGLNRGTRNMQRLGGLVDPNAAAADGKGSILLSTIGSVTGGTYDITIWLAKNQNTA